MKFPAIVKKQNERMIAYPRNTEEVSNILKFSNKNGLNIIAIGGETNRVDGTKPDQKSKNLFISYLFLSKKVRGVANLLFQNFSACSCSSNFRLTIDSLSYDLYSSAVVTKF